MPDHNYRPTVCKLCGGPADLETGVRLTIERGSERTQLALCGDCATVECGQCASDVPIRSVLGGRGRKRARGDLVECSRCNETVRAEHAVEIRHKQIKQYRKRVCGDCLDEVGVTGAYRVVREFSPI